MCWLQNNIPQYELWAVSAREWVSQLKNTRPNSEIKALNRANRAAVESFQLSLQRVEKNIKTMESNTTDSTKSLREEVASLRATVRLLSNDITSLLSQQRQPIQRQLDQQEREDEESNNGNSDNSVQVADNGKFFLFI